MRRVLPFIIVGLVAVVTVTSATVLYRAKKPVALVLSKDQSKPEGGDASHSLGPENAPVTLEEYGDFECPPCGMLAEPLNAMQRDFHPNVRLIFHQFPLPMHAHSMHAALASEAAALQGKFWEMHDLLYKEQAVWSKSEDPAALIRSYAGVLGLDISRFSSDVNDPKLLAKVREEQEKGAKAGVKNTPTVFLNGKEIPPPELAPPTLRKTVEEAAKAKPRS